MTALDPIGVTNRQTLPLDTNADTKPLGSGAKVHMGDAVPGATDNDANSWRDYLHSGVRSAQEGVAHALARLAAFGDAIDPNGFAEPTQADADAGYAFAVIDSGDPPTRLQFVPANETVTVTTIPSGSYRILVQMPRGVRPEISKVDHRRGQNRVNLYPRDADGWDPLSNVSGGSPHYDYYHLVDAGSGSTRGVSGVQIGDTFAMRIHHSSGFERFIVDQLPDVAGREDGNLVVLRRQDGTRLPGLYELESHPGDYYEGIVAASSLPNQDTVHLDQNPEGSLLSFGWTTGQSDTRGFVLFLRKSWVSGSPPTTLHVEATHYSADGSAIENNNAISGSAATRFAINRDPSDDGYYDDSYIYAGTGASAALIGLWRGFARGSRLRFKVYTDSSYTTELVDATTGHWNRLAFSAEEGLRLQAAIADLDKRVSTPDNSKIEHEIADLQDKTKAIGFDTAPQWADVGADDGTRYGKFFLGSGTDKATAFGSGLNYNGGEGFAPEFSSRYTIPAGTYWSHTSLAWVLPNDTTWDHLRIVATDPQGNVLFIQNAQYMRNVNNDIPVSNIPDDYTPRFMANEDRTIHTVGTMPAGTVLQIQSLGDQYVPIWEGEYKEGSLPLDAVEIDTRIQMERLITGLTQDLYKGRAHANYTVIGGVAQRRSAANVNSLDYMTEHDFRVVNTETEYAYLKRPTAAQSQDQDYEEISSLIVYDRDTKAIIAAAPIRAVDPDPRFWQTSDATITSVGTVFDFDYFEISYSATANQNIGVYFGQFIQWNRALLEESDLAQDVREKLNRNDRLKAEGAVGFAQFNGAGTGWLTSAPGVSHSGTTMTITPQEALKNNRRGIMVRCLGGTPEVQYSEVFIPWSQFRSLDGNVVNGGGNSREISQGILAGVTSPSNAGHTFFAQCQVSSSGLELQLNVPTRNNAAIWIHFAS